MSKETGKQVWVAPKLEQIAMVNTAGKGAFANENVNNVKSMSPVGMQLS